MRRGGYYVAVIKWVINSLRRYQPTDVSHVGVQERAVIIGNTTKLGIVQVARVTRRTYKRANRLTTGVLVVRTNYGSVGGAY